MSFIEIVRRPAPDLNQNPASDPAADPAAKLGDSEREQLHDNPLVDALLASRGVLDARELEFALADLPSPALLEGMDKATELLATAIAEDRRIMIVGDYDCDGATSSALALLALREMGANDIDFIVPSRFLHGYGLSPAIVEMVREADADLILTVDNGIASVEGVARARELGIDVVVTDHHLPPAQLPDANVLINPNLPGSQFPSGNIAGVGVIFFVMIALRARLVKDGWFEKAGQAPVNLANFLDLVAVGTVADVVPLDAVNRTLVEQGLRRMRAGLTRPGVLKLIEQAGRDSKKLAATDLGFVVGPRLNAAGRLKDMARGVECLITTDAGLAAEIAAELNAMNIERRRIEQDMRADTQLHIAELLEKLEHSGETMMALCLYEPHWHQGVIGILAGRLKEKFHVPAVIFAKDDDGRLKGSCRSIPELHILDTLKAVQRAHPHLFNKFGGHAMAAGLDIAEKDFPEFSKVFQQQVIELLGGVVPARRFETDGGLQSEEMTIELAEILSNIAPWGQGFPEPTFDNLFLVNSTRVLKERHLKLNLSLLVDSADQDPAISAQAQNTDGLTHPAGESVDAIWFGSVEPETHDPCQTGDTVRMVYRLNLNEFRGRVSLQLMVQHLELL